MNSAVDSASAKVGDDESRLQLDVTMLTGDDTSLRDDVLAAGGANPEMSGTHLNVHAAGNTALEVQAAPCRDLGTLISDYTQVYADVVLNNGKRVPRCRRRRQRGPVGYRR